jgi:hypothetical protein
VRAFFLWPEPGVTREEARGKDIFVGDFEGDFDTFRFFAGVGLLANPISPSAAMLCFSLEAAGAPPCCEGGKEGASAVDNGCAAAAAAAAGTDELAEATPSSAAAASAATGGGSGASGALVFAMVMRLLI